MLDALLPWRTALSLSLAAMVVLWAVGAFALAHAGLSLAFTIMAESTGNIVAGLLIMLLGNVIVILLEGLVVTIQTTRLILFEFFIRFLRSSGRTFRPLAAPEHAIATRE